MKRNKSKGNPLNFKPRIVKVAGKPVEAVFDYKDWLALVEAIEDAIDKGAYLIAKAKGGESFPIELVQRMMAGRHPIAVYREYRELTQAGLADKVGVTPLYISHIETGHRTGTLEVIARIAEALEVRIDDLVPFDRGHGKPIGRRPSADRSRISTPRATRDLARVRNR